MEFEEYKMLCELTVGQLEGATRLLKSKGFILYGSPFAIQSESRESALCQAMITPKETPDE